MENGHVEANGQRLYYEVHGEGEPVVLIGGWGDDVNAWAFQIPALAKHFKVITFDNRDIGRSSEATGSYSMKDMAEDTAGLLEGLDIRAAHIIGWSMGGAISQELVLRHPEKVRKLILAATMAQFSRFHCWLIEPMKFVKKNDSENRTFFELMLALCMTHEFLKKQEAVEEFLREMEANPFPQSPEEFERQGHAINSFDALDRLHEVKTPTLVLGAEQDILTPPWAMRELAEAISGAKIEMLEGGGHGFFWEIPDAANDALLKFLKA